MKPQSQSKVMSSNQTSISSFFRPVSGDKKIINGGKQSFATPLLTRSDSIISNATSVADEFNDVSNSDTSFDTSTEITNFRNPNLGKSFGHSKSFKNILSDEMQFGGIGAKKMNLTTPRINLKRRNEDIIDQKIKRHHSSSSMDLSDEQMSVITAVVDEKKNLFYTGSAGTGKSVVLRELVTVLKRIYQDKVGITASTGMAACNIQGQTLHKFLGIGLGTDSAQVLINRIKKNAVTLRKWQSLRVLVIDEISMIDGRLFDKLDSLGQALRGNTKPFGGIQVICTGDFFQLPPVSSGSIFCFQANSWKKVINKTILLTKVFRQKGDSELIDMLNSLRYGKLDQSIVSKFAKLQRRVQYNDGIEPTELYPTRAEVKMANNARLNQLRSDPVIFKAKDDSKAADRPDYKKQLDNLMVEETLVLKEGAQVMYLRNKNETIVNGSVGIVLFFMTKKLWIEVVKRYGFYDSEMLDELRLLSRRIGSVESWSESEARRYAAITPDRKSKFDALCRIAVSELAGDRLPVVKFNLEEPILVDKEEFAIELGKSYNSQATGQLTREQLPLLLSWAMSIHKAQGQTIERLRIDLGKTFENGQVYVALSRATSKESLEVYNFHPSKVRTAGSVASFYDELSRNQS